MAVISPTVFMRVCVLKRETSLCVCERFMQFFFFLFIYFVDINCIMFTSLNLIQLFLSSATTFKKSNCILWISYLTFGCRCDNHVICTHVKQPFFLFAFQLSE